MIFVCVGSRGYQFNRLLKSIDQLIEDGEIEEEVFAQIGGSDYLPLHYKYERYLDESKFHLLQREAGLIISHGGTGALITALKQGKQVVAVPRLHSYGEHIDDHQLQVVGVLEKQGYVHVAYDMDELGRVIKEAKEHPIHKKYDLPSHVISVIDAYIKEELK